MNNKPLEGNPEGTGEAPANASSSAPESQPLGGDLPKLIADLQKKIDAQDGEIRALKSGKDKAVDRVVKSNEETLAKFAKYLNVDEEQLKRAQRDAALDDIIAERTGGRQSESTISGKVDEQGSRVELGFIDTALELPANDSRVTDLKLKYGSNPTEYLKQAVTLKASFNQNPATPAEQLLPEGGGATRMSEEEIERDLTKYEELNRNRTLNRVAISVLETKLRKAGVIT